MGELEPVAWCAGIVDGRAKRVQARPFAEGTPLVALAAAERAVADAAEWEPKLSALASTFGGVALGAESGLSEWDREDGKPWTLAVLVHVSPHGDPQWVVYQGATPGCCVQAAWGDLVDGPAVPTELGASGGG